MRLLLALALVFVPAVAFAAEPKPTLDRHGDPLPEKALLRLGTVQYRVPNLAGVGFKKTGELVALTQKLELVEWPADCGAAKVRALPGWKAGGNMLQMSPDAKYAADMNANVAGVIVWDIAGETAVEYLTKDFQYASLYGFSPDGRFLSLVRTDVTARPIIGYLLVCELKTKKWSEFKLPGSTPSPFAYSRNGRYAVAAFLEGVFVYDLQEAKELVRVKPLGQHIAAVAVSDDGKTLAVLPLTFPAAKEPSPVRLYDATNGGDATELLAPAVAAEWVGFSPDGKALRFGVKGQTREWDPVAGKWLGEPTAARDRDAVFSPDGKRYVARTASTAVIVRDAKTHKPLHPVAVDAGHTEGIRGVAVSPDGKTAVTHSGLYGEWCLWELTTGKLIHKARGSSWGRDKEVAFLPDSTAFVVAAEDGLTPVVHDATTGQELRRFKVADDLAKTVRLGDLEVSADGKTLTADAGAVSSDLQSLVVRWDVAKGTETERANAKSKLFRQPQGEVFSPDGRWKFALGSLNLVGDEKKIEVVPRAEFAFAPPHFSADSRYMLVGRRDMKNPRDQLRGGLVVFDLTTRKQVHELPTGRVAAVAFSADGRHLATTGLDAITVWELATGKSVWRAASPAGGTGAVTFTPDGRRLITGHDTTALVWDVSAATGKK